MFNDNRDKLGDDCVLKVIDDEDNVVVRMTLFANKGENSKDFEKRVESTREGLYQTFGCYMELVNY